VSPLEYKPLAEVADIHRHTVKPLAAKAETLYVGLEDIRGSSLVSARSVAAAGVSSTKFQFPVGAVLYGKLRPNLGKVALAPFQGVCSTDILPIVPRASLDGRFLHRYLSSPAVVAEATRLASGANLPRLSPRQVAGLRIPVRPLEEQRRIADVLDRADELRAKRRDTLAFLDELTQSIFVDMFESSLSVARLPLGALIAAPPRNGLYKPSSRYGSGTRIVRIDSFGPGETIEPSRLRRVSVSDDELARWRVQDGTILVNRVNSLSHIGKAGLVGPSDEPLIFESNMMALTPDADAVLPEYLLAALTRPSARRQFRSSARLAINQASVNQTDVAAISIPTPPLEEQRAFVTAARRLDTERYMRLRDLALLDELFASLQQRAFRGDLFSSPLPPELADAVA
jgi:type I restriction enzyme, S subunit